MHKLFVNLRYFLTPTLILFTLLGIVVGGDWVWTGIGLFIASIILDYVSSAMKNVRCAPPCRDEDC